MSEWLRRLRGRWTAGKTDIGRREARAGEWVAQLKKFNH